MDLQQGDAIISLITRVWSITNKDLEQLWEKICMRKFTTILMLSMVISLCGCGSTDESETSQIQNESIAEPEMSEKPQETQAGNELSQMQTENAVSDVVQGGPYGEISLSLPDGWSYELCPIDSDSIMCGMYGIHFYPESVTEGYIELVYMDSFGVCGTGLETENAMIAGNTADIGTYDGHMYWDFISFRDEYEGIVALTYSVDTWWSEYGDQVMDILNTVSFNPNVKAGGAYIYHEESENDEIGLYFSLKNISSTGATICFRLYDPDAPTGELYYGDDFVFEVQKNGKWEEIPVIVEGDYAFHDIAYTITAGDGIEQEMNWEWLYGELAPGEYRIGKCVNDFRKTGDFDSYMMYAHFILN